MAPPPYSSSVGPQAPTAPQAGQKGLLDALMENPIVRSLLGESGFDGVKGKEACGCQNGKPAPEEGLKQMIEALKQFAEALDQMLKGG